MVENFEFKEEKGKEDLTSVPSFAEMMDNREMRREGGSDRQISRLDGDAEARLERAQGIMEPIIKGIQSLPREMRLAFVDSVKDMDGPAYDLVRRLCTG